MHQAIHWEDAACHAAGCAAGCHSRATRPRSGACPSGKACAGLGLQVLMSDPLIDMVYRAGVLSLRDMRVLAGCTASQAIWDAAQERARLRLATAAGRLRGLRAAFEVCAARVRGLALDAETRLLQLGVPMNTVHPELSSPLKGGEALHHALYAGLFTLNQVLRAATHPAAWAEQPEGLWDALAASAGLSMRPQLVLLLSCLLPVEARLSYLSLRHEAYSHAAPNVRDLGGLVKSVLLRMMLYPFSRTDLPRLCKQLKALRSPHASPFSFWLLRRCAAGAGAAGLTLAQRQAQRAEDEGWLSARVDALFASRQEQVLYSGDAWLGWLHGLPTRFLVAFYVKYLLDSWQ